MYSYAQWLEDYRERWRSIITLVDEIPCVDEQAIEDMVGNKFFLLTAEDTLMCCLQWIDVGGFQGRQKYPPPPPTGSAVPGFTFN